MRCWLLPNGRIFSAAAGILCVGLAYCTCIFLRCPHVGATLAFPVAPRTHRQRGRKAAQSGDTRLTAANRARCGRVQGCKLFKVLPPCPLAPAFAIATDRRGDQKQCRDFALRSSVSAPRYQAALQEQRLLLLALAVSKTCAVHLPSSWSLSVPARCRLEYCQQSHHRSLSTESHARDANQ